MDFTRKEKDLVNKAWTNLRYLAEQVRNHYELDRMLSYERRERKNATVAKILMLRAFKENRADTLVDISYYSQGLQFAAILGARIEDEAHPLLSSERATRMRFEIEQTDASILRVETMHDSKIHSIMDQIKVDNEAARS